MTMLPRTTRSGVAVLLGAAAGDVVGEDAALLAVDVVPREERHHGEALHGHGEVGADHGGEPVGLALQGELGALDLLEVLQLQLEQLDHLHGQSGGAGDAHRRVLVGREDLLDVARLESAVSRARSKPRASRSGFSSSKSQRARRARCIAAA
ncbi:hypothetical protein SCYAM73S_05744 [Streptomyces cyaneofuscatus]